MALQHINGLILSSAPNYGGFSGTVTLNNTGESSGVIGRIRWKDQATSKVVSSAGGAIIWIPGAITFANAGTEMSIGIQDVNLSTGLEDGTFDVRASLIGGGGGITASAYNITAMTTGTKTLSDGDLIAVVCEMTTRAGADQVIVNSGSVSGIFSGITIMGLPYGSQDTGALAKTTGELFWCLIIADDGTPGWIEGVFPLNNAASSVAVNSGSTPDEYAGTFSVAFECEIRGIGVVLSGIATADAFEVILYSDPLGSPVAAVTVTPDQDVVGGATVTAGLHIFPITATTLTPGTMYGIAVRPTTANNINYHYMDTNNATYVGYIRQIMPLKDLKLCARTNQTGAFVEVANDQWPMIYIDISKLNDNISAGGSSSYAFS